MLTQYVNDKGLVFSVNMNGHDIHFKEWSATDDCIYYFPLATLVDNGQAGFYKHECTVPYENIYLLDEEDRELLGVPAPYNMALRLRGEGLLNSADFKYKVEFLTYVPDGELLCVERGENILVVKQKKYLLSEAQYELVRRIDTYNALPETEKNTDFNFRQFASIKSLALQAGCELDSYLANEEVFTPERIRIEVGRDEEGFTIDPAIDSDENAKFQHTFDRMRRAQSVYPIQKEDGSRVRVVLDPVQKEDLARLKQTGGRHKTREEIQKLVEHPTEFFDPEVFDLSDLYSDRVIKIGLYQPKFYPFICPYKSCWIMGAKVESRANGTSNITIKNQDELSLLQQAIAEAKESNQDVVSFQDAEIALDDAAFLVETAKEQLQHPETPIKVKDKKEREVLIIEENAEELGFAVKQKVIEQGDRYTLFTDPFLQAGFSLKTHQEEGIAWLQHLYRSKASGCLMADDMGLGKTLQILYLIDWHSRTYKDHKPYLIVAPVSLLENWKKEYKRFFDEPRLSVNVLSSRIIPRKFDKAKVEAMQQMDIILTNYESLRNAQLNFCAVDFDIIVLDEAQKIKAPGTLVTNAVKALKGRFKVAMTGTPVENTLLDLWCIMDFCVPGLLGNAKAFAAKYQNPLKKEDTDLIELGNQLHDELGVYFIRRLKQDAAKDLPRKIERKERVVMPSAQETTYMRVVDEYNQGIQSNMLITIMNIREVSEHPYLYNCTWNQHEEHELINDSARLIATVDFLDAIRVKDEKVIIFAERKEIQKLLQKLCLLRYGIVTKIINGDTPSIVRRKSDRQSRQQSIDEFQSVDGFNVIIMSPVAAGMGLNVTAANHVIHYSWHWNPAKENQATDRAYRIGQTKDVFVYYPMAVSEHFKSFDESLDELLSRKTNLATSTIFPTERVEVKRDELGQMLFNL